MSPTISPVKTQKPLPARSTVVVIGGGIVGLASALNLAERGIPVVVLEKGKIAGEQSSRNLGWVRKLNRAENDIPLSLLSQRLWKNLHQRTGMDVGYRKAGMMFLARKEAELEEYNKWLEAVKHLPLKSRLISKKYIDELVPGGSENWVGGLYDPDDGYAEPTLASSAIAIAAQKKGVVIVENCAVRTLSLTAGRVTGVVTEHGEINCETAVLAGGLWSRRFLGNHGVDLPTLPLIGSVLRTAPIDGPSDVAVGASNFSFRKRQDGGYTIMQRGAVSAPLTQDHLRIGFRYTPMLKANWKQTRISLGRYFLEEMRLARHWTPDDISPFEKKRTLSPHTNTKLIEEAMANLIAAWPVFKNAKVEESWAGFMDVTPDSYPVISTTGEIPGLIIATGFSGHGFGTSPGAGHLVADLVMNETAIVDPAPYSLNRF